MARKLVIPRLRVWLLLGNSITQREAIEKWDAYRLSHSIFILRTKYGMNIETEMCSTKNSVYARYSLETLKPKLPCKPTTKKKVKPERPVVAALQ